MGYYLPPYRNFSAAFAQSVINGTKKLLLRSQVKFVNRLYSFPECSRGRLLGQFVDGEALDQYIPQNINSSLIDKQYLLNVR